MNHLGLQVFRDELRKGPNKATFLEQRLLELGYLLKSSYNAFKGVATRILKVGQGVSGPALLRVVLITLLALLVML